MKEDPLFVLIQAILRLKENISYRITSGLGLYHRNPEAENLIILVTISF